MGKVIIKIIGIITKLQKFNSSTTIHINTVLPCDNSLTPNIQKKVLEVNKIMLKKLYNFNIDEDIDEIKLNTPIYYIYDKEYKKKNMFIKFKLPKRFKLQDDSIGKKITIYASYSTYNFNDKTDKSIKIRGWGFQIKNIL